VTTQKEVIQAVLSGRKPPYVPWALSFTLEAREKLVEYSRSEDLPTLTGSHLVGRSGSLRDGADMRRRGVK